MHFLHAILAAVLVAIASSSRSPSQHAASGTASWQAKLQSATTRTLRNAEKIAACMHNTQFRECLSPRVNGSSAEKIAACMHNTQSRECISLHINEIAASDALDVLDRFCEKVESGTLGFLPSSIEVHDMVGNATRLVDSIGLLLTYDRAFNKFKLPKFSVFDREDHYTTGELETRTSEITRRLRNLAPVWQQFEVIRQDAEEDAEEDAEDTIITIQLQDRKEHGSLLQRLQDRIRSGFNRVNNALSLGSDSPTIAAEPSWARVTICDSSDCELDSTIALHFWHVINSSAFQNMCLDETFPWENHPLISLPTVTHNAKQDTVTKLGINIRDTTSTWYRSFEDLLASERRSTLRSVFCAKPLEDMEDYGRPFATIPFRETVLAKEATQAWNKIILPVDPIMKSSGFCGYMMMKSHAKQSTRKQAFFWRVLAEYPRPAAEIARELRDQIVADKKENPSLRELPGTMWWPAPPQEL